MSGRATVHNIRHERMQEGDVYIGRAGKGQDGYFGNPFTLRSEAERSTCLAQFREYAIQRLFNDEAYLAAVKGLHGKRLFCFCAPLACHGHVLAQLAEELQSGQ